MTDYVLEGPKWGSSALGSAGGLVTWATAATVPSSVVADLSAAFADWAKSANIQFQQVASTAAAKIDFSFGAIDGLDDVLGQTNYSYSGSSMQSADVEFDSGEGWHGSGSTVVSADGVNFFVVALHEIGHALGLDHYNAAPAVMNAELDRAVTDLTRSDIDGIQALYGAGSAGPLATAGGGGTQTAAFPGLQSLASGTNVDDETVGGNVWDYTLRQAGDGSGGYTLVPLNGSGTISIASEVPTVHFQDGQYLALHDLSAFIPSQLVIAGASGGAVTAPVGGDAFLDGQSGGRAVVNGNTGDYTLDRLQSAPSGDPSDEQGAFVLESRNGSGDIAVSQSTGAVQFQNGQYLSLKDLSAYIASTASDTPSYTVGGGGDDLLTVPLRGDQYIVGNGGTDALYLHGNTADYTIKAVDLAATSSHPAVAGDELLARNGSGNLFIDKSTESVHFQNGQYLAFKDLSAFIAPGH